MRGHTLFRALSIAALLSCYVTILVGGNVIATGSGLGCSEWPACESGHIVPPLTGAAAIEFSHRAAAFLLSVFVLALTIAAFVWEGRRRQLIRLSTAALVTVVLEAVLGGVVVDSDLTVAIVLVHFAIATVLFALLLLIALLANVRELPPHWKTWARHAIDGTPAPPTFDPPGTVRPAESLPPVGALGPGAARR